LSLLFNFVLEYTIRKVPASQEGLKLNGKHQFLAYAVDIIKVVSREADVKVNTEN